MNGLRVVFKERCINVSEFAKKIGVPRTSVYTALSEESKVGRISVDLFLAIADGLGEDPRELREKTKRIEETTYHAVKLEGDSDD